MLSIIIITKNEEQCLPRLLESIKKQDYKNYEIIVSDANSTDKTRKIAKSYGCSVIEGGLPSVGRNNGAKIAKGDLLLFLDADVVLPEGFLKNCVEEIKSRKLSAGTPIYKPITKRIIDKFLHGVYNSFAEFTQYFFPHAGGYCIFCTKKAFNSVNGFNENLLICEDHNFVHRVSKIGKFRILKSKKILCDVRRLDKEGRWGLSKKFLTITFHRVFKGEMFELPFSYTLQGGVDIRKRNSVKYITYKKKMYYSTFFINFYKLSIPLILKMYNVRIKNVIGSIQPNGPFLIASHHEEVVDHFIIGTKIKRRLFLVGDTSYNIPLADTKIRKFLMQRIGVIPIDKKNTERNINLFDYLLFLLEKGESIVFFPEGCLKKERGGKKFGDFKDGVVRLALEYKKKFNKKIPIYPIGLKYSDGEVEMSIGSAFFVDKLEDRRELFNRIKELS